MTEGPHSDRTKTVFNPPPNWPVEPGFFPLDGWKPQLSWGPAPDGWVFWLPNEPSAGIADGQIPERPRDTKVINPPPGVITRTEPKGKSWWPILVAAIVTVGVVIFAVLALMQHQQRVAEQLVVAQNGYDSSLSELETAIGTAEDVLAQSEGAVLDESTRGALLSEITEASAVVTEGVDPNDQEALTNQAIRLNSTQPKLEDAVLEVENDVAYLTVLTAARKETAETIADARGDLAIAEQLLKETDGKVSNPVLRDGLATTVETVRTHIEKDPSVMVTDELAELNEGLGQARRDVQWSLEKVRDDHAEWQKAIDAAAASAALLDPAAYASISSREWQFVERDPAGQIDKKYIIFGRVTQFDSNTGRTVFRADTDGQKQSKWYDYDVNTMVTGTEEALTNVVQGDLVKLFVSVAMPYSYTTTMGAELTVPMVKANIIEVYGSE